MAIQLLNEIGEASDLIISGKSLVIRLDYEAYRDFEQVNFGIGFRTLSGATLSTAAHMIKQFQYGDPDHLTLKGKDGTIFLYQVNEQMILTALAPNDVSLGIFTLGINRAIKDINHFAKRPDY